MQGRQAVDTGLDRVDVDAFVHRDLEAEHGLAGGWDYEPIGVREHLERLVVLLGGSLRGGWLGQVVENPRLQ